MKKTLEQGDGAVADYDGLGILLLPSHYFGDGLADVSLSEHLIELVTGKPGYLVGL